MSLSAHTSSVGTVHLPWGSLHHPPVGGSKSKTAISHAVHQGAKAIKWSSTKTINQVEGTISRGAPASSGVRLGLLNGRFRPNQRSNALPSTSETTSLVGILAMPCY